jgi:hypothetical protein
MPPRSPSGAAVAGRVIARSVEDRLRRDITRATDKAREDLAEKTLRDIQVETSKVWTGRAIAAKDIGQHADAIEYAHEAVEHAALSGDDTLLAIVREMLSDADIALY